MRSNHDTQSQTQEYDYLFKYLIVGNANVGKSNLLLRYADNKFTDSYISTIGVDFKITTCEVEGKTVKQQLWDTAGQERYQSIVASYYRGAHAVILVAGVDEGYPSISDRIIKDSDEKLREQLKLIASYANQKPSVILVINGTDKAFRKAQDESSKQRVQAQLAKAQEDLLNLANTVLNPAGISVHNKVFLTSAKDKVGVNELFVESARVLVQCAQEEELKNPASYNSRYSRPRQQPFSPIPSYQADKKDGFFKSIWNGIYGLLSAIIGGIVNSLANIAIINPLALTYLRVQQERWLLKPVWLLISPLMAIVTLIYGLYSLFTGLQDGWNNGITAPFKKIHNEFAENKGNKAIFNHALASWLVLGITAAVVLAMIFPPMGLAAMIPTMTAAVGLSGVSTAVLAVIAGAATIAIGSLVYGLTNLAFGGEKVKGQSAAKSMEMDYDQEQLLPKDAPAGAGPTAHPAAAPGLAGDDVGYANPIGELRQADASRPIQPPASEDTAKLTQG